MRYDKCRVRRVRQLVRRPNWTPQRSSGGPEGTRRVAPSKLSGRTIFNELAALFFIAVLFTSAALVRFLRVGRKKTHSASTFLDQPQREPVLPVCRINEGGKQADATQNYKAFHRA
jgi:hypothetical protein